MTALSPGTLVALSLACFAVTVVGVVGLVWLAGRSWRDDDVAAARSCVRLLDGDEAA